MVKIKSSQVTSEAVFDGYFVKSSISAVQKSHILPTLIVSILQRHALLFLSIHHEDKFEGNLITLSKKSISCFQTCRKSHHNLARHHYHGKFVNKDGVNVQQSCQKSSRHDLGIPQE